MAPKLTVSLGYGGKRCQTLAVNISSKERRAHSLVCSDFSLLNVKFNEHQHAPNPFVSSFALFTITHLVFKLQDACSLIGILAFSLR